MYHPLDDAIVWLVFVVHKGTFAANKLGPDPKAEAAPEPFPAAG